MTGGLKRRSAAAGRALLLGGGLIAGLAAAQVPASTSASAAPAPAPEPASRTSAFGGGWQFGAVLDTAATSRALELGGRDQGLQLGHSDLTAAGPLGRHLQAQITGVLATHEGSLEKEIEEAWVETRALPLGLNLRAGRFASQIGYLNQQHPHADDFVERPLLYRAFLGGHWNDDGLRLNVTLPTSFYWMLGVEAFRGHTLVEEADPEVGGVGAYTLSTRLGGDIGLSQSWQFGVSYLRSRRIAAVEEEEGDDHDDHDDGHGDEHGHHHHHGAQFGGRHLWLVDATWKWAPDGNNRERQLRLSAEAARVTGLNRHADARQRHEAYGLAAVWRFDANWETGLRFDRLRVAMAHGDHFHAARLNEQALMLAWKPSHRQSLRLQWTRQHGAVGFESPVGRSLALQYVLAFGAHGAHAY